MKDYRNSGRDDYVKGLTEQDANILAKELNQVCGGTKKTTQLITYFFNCVDLPVTRHENYIITYDSNNPLDKNHLKSPTFQELNKLKEEFQKRQNLQELIKLKEKSAKLENELKGEIQKEENPQELRSLKEKLNELENKPLLEKGQKIYVPSSLYLSHAIDDFSGGIATISLVEEERVTIAENPRSGYSIESLLKNQILWKMEYTKNKARACPDHSPEFNQWD